MMSSFGFKINNDRLETGGFIVGVRVKAVPEGFLPKDFESTPKSKIVHIQNLAVLPKWRGNGLAKRLLDRILEDCNLHWICLEVRADNHAAVGLYESRGFSNLLSVFVFSVKREITFNLLQPSSI